MTERSKLDDVVDRYSRHPEFLGVDIINVNQPGAMGDTMLHIAARRGVIGDITTLLDAGALVNASGDLGYTPLHAAAMGGDLAAVQTLLQFGADPTLVNEFGETPGTVARQLGHTKIAALLEGH